MTVARYWRQQGDALVCELCAHGCPLSDGQVGRCGVRQARDGELLTSADGSCLVVRVDSIERKFLYHVAPGARCLSFGVPGCNLRCQFCQNHLISQASPATVAVPTGRYSPAELVHAARLAGCHAVAATYTEPTVFCELALQTAELARRAGLLNVWKSNGLIERRAQLEVAERIDAINVDLKAMDHQVHERLTGAPLRPVLAALTRYRQLGVWLEVTTLVIPTLTDDRAQLGAAAAFIRDQLGPETPWHLTRFHPDHLLRDLPPTPAATLHAAREAALDAGLRYVYTDVEPSGRGWDTICRFCGERLLERAQYQLLGHRLRACGDAGPSCDGWAGCPRCGAALPGVALRAALDSGKEATAGSAS